MNNQFHRTKESAFLRAFRQFIEQLTESFESPQARQFRLMKKYFSE